ncbi:N-acetyl sugar amidotransferase [Paracoccaceae bacterium]|nr:N-acetyl sugar amidotransferase [Paracoccaceae bacterium]
MRYCKNCLYPENAKPTIIFDDQGVCSGCNYNNSRKDHDVDWVERREMFEEIVAEAKAMAKERGNPHDCIVPVSGGKDSHFQVWLLKEKYGMNPLLVSFNHGFNTPAGLRNLNNLIEKSGCDAIVYTAGVDSVRKISRYMLEKVGDITWHYHAGIRTLPFKIAVEKNIPLIVWGEHGFAELTGIVSLKDFVEFTKWNRVEHDMRGIEAEQLIGHNGITRADIDPYIYPEDDLLEEVEVRGIYISNFFEWNAEEHAKLMKSEWDFGYITYKRDRTFSLYSKIEDHANDVHDYLKYLKFGYGRATDDASMEIRHGRITREEGLKLVKEYDSKEPQTLQFYCDFLGITKTEFYQIVESMRDENIWTKTESGWKVLDSCWKNVATDEIKYSSDIFSSKYSDMYYNQDSPPVAADEDALDNFPQQYKWS